MLRAYHRRTLGLALVLTACTGEPAADSAPASPAPRRVGEDCGTLIQAAQRAQACDPALSELAERVRSRPDESHCREQARRLLSASPSDARVHGVYEGSASAPPEPLTAEERERLLTLPLPGILHIRPDLPLAPGIPATTVLVDQRSISPRHDGSFFVHAAPGELDLHITHAGEQRDFCAHVDACERLELTAHGAQLARHERLSPGACGQPGLTVAAGDD